LTDHIRIRAAERADVPVIFALIVELATYERAPEQVLGNERLLETALFGPDPTAEAVIAELDGVPVAFALFFRTFSTWLCRPGLWLEDLYVSAQHRRAGVGRALLGHLAAVALERGYGRLEWTALHWNEPALRFYDSLGAQRLHEWQTLRLTGEALERIARAAEPAR
jgi:GNAT superfamily N-acetyltransferase